MASYHRAALFVFFDAIESDLKNKIRLLCLDNEGILSKAEREKALRRIEDVPFSNADVEDFDLVDRLDLGDKYDIILRWKSKLSAQESKLYSDNNELFKSCISVRNAVMHGRPLTTDEFAKAFALVELLKKSSDYFPDLSAVVSSSEKDPRKFMQSIENVFDENVSFGVFNNLPSPDYEDTGFLPRNQLESELKKKILGRHPVITVLGDGGNGKTALTLQVMYGLLNSNDHDFDAIVWVSAKSSRLTTNEIERIGNAISNSLELFNEVAAVFEDEVSEPIERVRSLLLNNKILLVIDNLETVLDRSIIDFASDVPGHSKIVFTSRVPLGSDLTVTVGSLSESEGLSYLRTLINSYSIDSLRKATNEELKLFVGRLGSKPLLLKWFILGVASGLSPHQIVKNPVHALKFCMENIFEALSDNAKCVVALLIALPRAASQAILQHVSDISAGKIESAVAELLKFAIIEEVKDNKYETNYQVKPFARSYAVRVLEITGDVNTSEVLAKYRSVEGTLQTVRGQAQLDRYNMRSYTVRSKSEALSVIKLKKAMSCISDEDYDQAFALIDDAKTSNPTYFEVYRVEAFALFKKGDFTNAKVSYESALELAGGQPQIFFFYGGFLLRAYSDMQGAIDALDQAYKLDPNSVEVLRELARASIYGFDFEKAHALLENWHKMGVKSSREATKLADLQVQAYTRQLEYLLQNSSDPDIEKALLGFEAVIDTFERTWLDSTLVEHLQRAEAILTKIERSQRDIATTILAEKIVKLIQPNANGTQMGKLKEKGRRPTYGFLVDFEGTELFVPKAVVPDEVWDAMCEGESVVYEIVERNGKKQAANVRLTSQ